MFRGVLNIKILSLLGIILLSPILSHAAAPKSCRQYIGPPPYGQIHSWFNHNNKYDSQITRIRIKNQCATGHCHLYTWSSELESRSGIRLSNAYLDAMNLYNNAVSALKEGKTTISHGAFSLDSRLSIQAMGLVPASAWRGPTDFISSNTYSKLVAGLEAMLTNAHAKANNLKATEGTEILIQNTSAEIFQMINSMAGPIPQQFRYRGKTYTPRSFSRQFFPDLELPIVEVSIAHNSPKISFNNKDWLSTKIEASWENAERLMTTLIDQGRPIYLAYNHEKQYIDNKTGIMSISAFSYPNSARILERETISQYYKWSGGHAVLIVGYQRNPRTGLVEKWKIQNSWGKETGDLGYYHMYRDFLHMFGWGFSFVNDGSLPIRDLLGPSSK